MAKPTSAKKFSDDAEKERRIAAAALTRKWREENLDRPASRVIDGEALKYFVGRGAMLNGEQRELLASDMERIVVGRLVAAGYDHAKSLEVLRWRIDAIEQSLPIRQSLFGPKDTIPAEGFDIAPLSTPQRQLDVFVQGRPRMSISLEMYCKGIDSIAPMLEAATSADGTVEIGLGDVFDGYDKEAFEIVGMILDASGGRPVVIHAGDVSIRTTSLASLSLLLGGIVGNAGANPREDEREKGKEDMGGGIRLPFPRGRRIEPT